MSDRLTAALSDRYIIARELGSMKFRMTMLLFAGAFLLGGVPLRGIEAQGYTETVCAQGKGGIALSVKERFIVLEGGICPKDDEKFAAFLKTADPALRTIKLASGGGNGPAAQAIGAIIRDGGYDTYMDGATDKCASAWTHVFASGNHRYYSGADTITTGTTAGRGLGYHYPDARHTDESDADKDKKFNATTVPFLNKMLPPRAANAVIALMSDNRTTKVTWLNGAEALRSGIATSLAVPR